MEIADKVNGKEEQGEVEVEVEGVVWRDQVIEGRKVL